MKKKQQLLLIGIAMVFVVATCYLYLNRDYVATSEIHVFKLDGESIVKAVKADGRFSDVILIYPEESYEIQVSAVDENETVALAKINEVIKFIQEWGDEPDNRRYSGATRTWDSPVGDTTPVRIERSWW